MAGKIFINYRRGDDSGYAGRLYDRLQDKFEPQQIFMDVDSIAPGLDFVRELNDRVAECDVLLAVIGKDWIDARNAAGGRRLDDPDDFVRIEIAAALSRDKRVIPVLVGGAQMPRPEELPEPLRPLARRNAVRLTYERFRADTQGLVKALQRAFEEIEILEKSKAESEEAARRAEEERRRREREAEIHAAEAERTRLAEDAARQAKDDERRRLEAAAELREREERGFNAAKNANSVAAFDAFLAEHPKSHFGAEAQRLQAALRKREAAFAEAMASNDAAALRSFRDRYKDGTDVEKVRKRLQLIAPEQARPQPNFVIIGLAAFAVLVVGAAGVWWLMRPGATTQQASLPANAGAPPQAAQPRAVQTPASAPPKLTEAPPVQQPPVAPPTPSPGPEPKNAAADIPPPQPLVALPDNDVDAWAIVKNTSDVALLRRFIAQFPDSFLRRAAEARITALAAVQAAWILLKDSQDPEQLRRFIQAFPNSEESKAAEQRLAIISGAAPVSQPPTTTR
ncbi:MAG: toll/interleukin-1 receptor domain-containing protein [Xanthobacteraceae bacterium]